MKRIARFFLPPAPVLAASVWGIYNYFIDPDPMWRYPKAEALSIIGVVLGLAYLVYNVIAFVRTSRPIVPGMRVMFEVRGGPVVGQVLSVEGSGLVVQTDEGSFQIERNAVDDIV